MQKASDRTSPSRLSTWVRTISFTNQEGQGPTDVEFVYHIGEGREIVHGSDNVRNVFAI